MNIKKILMSAYIYALILLINNTIYGLSSLAKNDAYPIFTTQDPHEYILSYEKLCYKGIPWASEKGDRFSITASGFGQNADRGKTMKGESTFDMTTGENTKTELGDLTGKSSMIALLYGDLPTGANYGPKLTEAREQLFPDVAISTPLTNAEAIDPEQKFGFYSFPLKYRKRGARFEIMTRIAEDFGVSIQTGIASICQTVESRDNLTTEDPSFSCPELVNVTRENVNCYLMDQLVPIADEINLNICDFNETSIEEIRLNLFWRHMYECTPCDTNLWPHVLIIPFVELSGTISPGKKKDVNALFGVPFGNNTHNGIGFTTGIDFDFVDTVEIGIEGGVTHFFEKSFSNFHVPNSELQSNLFPFTTDVEITPGYNWHFGAKMGAYHFADNLSLYFQYLIVEHKADSMKIKNNDPAFKPKTWEKTTAFKTKLANIGFNYDICPNLILGVLWQVPFGQRNSYRSTTILFSVNATF